MSPGNSDGDFNDCFEDLTAWGIKTNSIFGMPDRSLRDPQGAVLIDRENGKVDAGAQVPYPLDAQQRSQSHREQLAKQGIDVMSDLPPSISEEEVVLRPADEVGWRMLALFIVAVRAESVASGQPIPADQLKAKSPMAFEATSPAEKSFLETTDPDQQTVVTFAWRYEALYALQWAIGLHADLSPPQ